MSQTGFSRGAELLKKWRGKRKQSDVLSLLGVEAANYSRYETGERKPPAEVGLRIDRVTGGRVPYSSWYEASVGDAPIRRKRRAA